MRPSGWLPRLPIFQSPCSSVHGVVASASTSDRRRRPAAPSTSVAHVGGRPLGERAPAAVGDRPGPRRGQPRAASHGQHAGPKNDHRTPAASRPTSSCQPQNRADSVGQVVEEARRAARRGRRRRPRARGRRPRRAAAARRPSRCARSRGRRRRRRGRSSRGRRRRARAPTRVTGRQPRSPSERAIQSSSTCMSLSTCGSPSITTRSNVEPDFPSALRNGSALGPADQLVDRPGHRAGHAAGGPSASRRASRPCRHLRAAPAAPGRHVHHARSCRGVRGRPRRPPGIGVGEPRAPARRR